MSKPLDWDEWVKVSGLEQIWKRVQQLDYMDGDDPDVFERMMFAYFIIQECVQVCNNLDTDYEGEDVLATWCAAAIKRHFGVE
jgi:hypothetical protein